ncbi:MAG: insulinase family protein [Bacteroidetes bacterium]|nr:insulinase family protein [Bacteroidota bacterium]
MKKRTLSILSIALAISATAQPLDRSIRPKPGPAPEIKLGKTESFTLPNGLKVFVVENHKLPTISASIQLDIQPALQGDMTGYRDMMSELLLSGTKTRSNDKLNQEIDFIGATINASDEGLSAKGMKKYQSELFALMADIAINADIKQTELDKIKTRAISGLEAEENEPDAMLKKVSAAINFGNQHPYGEITTKESIKKITLAKVKQYYSTYFRPNVAYMAVVGDITLAEAKPLIERYFGAWQKAAVPTAKYSNPTAPATRRVIFVPRDGAVQSVISLTYPTDLKPGTPDVLKTRVANSILGGGSNGRLFLNLREKHGWTYGSYSSISPDILKATFEAYAKGRNVVTDSSVNEIIAEMNHLRTEKVGKEELQNHLVNMSGAFAIGLESPSTVAQYAINIERYKMPKDYYQNYLKNLAAVSSDDVQAAAQKYIDPDHANIVVVGNKDIAASLARFASNGKVEYFDTYGRPIKEEAKAAAPTNLTANDVIKKYVAAIGGEAVVSNIKDIKTISNGSVQGIALTITEMKKSPDKLKFTMEGMGMVLQKKVFDGTKGYQEAQGKRIDMDADDLADAKESADIQADLHPEKFGKNTVLKGIEKVNGSDAYVLEEEKGKDKTKQYYDVKTGFLVKSVQTSEQGSVGQEYSDYKEVPNSGGYKIPYSIKIAAGPQNIALQVQSVEVNKNIPDNEFQ